MPRRWPGRCSRRGASMSRRRGPRRRSMPICAIRWRRSTARRRSRQGGDRGAAGRQAGRAAGVREAAGRAGRQGRRAEGRLQARSSSPVMSATWSSADADGPIGIVTVAGEIVDGKAAAGIAGGETIARLIEKGLRDDGLKALVVRVDSPGGSAIASERIRQAIARGARRRKFRWSSRWAMSPRRAVIGWRPRATGSSPSRRPSPDRSACSASCRASRAAWRSSGSAPTGSRRRRCRASPTCSPAPRPRPTG